MTKNIDRRALMKHILAAQSIAILPVGVGYVTAASATEDQISPAQFPQGVASADPQIDGIMLWTRAVPTQGGKARVVLDVAEDAQMTKLVLSRVVETDASRDFTLSAYVDGLKADTHYYYRFRALDGTSRLGRTRTAPSDNSKQPVRFAFMSCQSYEDGFYHAWARMIADDEAAPADRQIQFVLNLGDFIYEKVGYALMDPVIDAALGHDPARRLTDATGKPRSPAPFPSGGVKMDSHSSDQLYAADTLADYRHLYKTYLSDPNLQAARARWPIISTWDDHEFMNDAWQSQGTDGPANTQGGPFQRRKIDANRAWSEFMPAILSDGRVLDGIENPASDFALADVQNTPFKDGEENADNQAALNTLTIYRRLRYGALIDLILTDTRSYRSSPTVPIDWRKENAAFVDPSAPVWLVDELAAGRTAHDDTPATEFKKGELIAPNPRADAPVQSALGADQKNWFKQTLKQSTAQWKIWGNAIPLSPVRINLSALPFMGFDDVTISEDAWDGFPQERAEIAQFVLDENIHNVVSLAGDHHMHMASMIETGHEPSTIAAAGGQTRPALPEFATAGVSSLNVMRGMARTVQGGSFEGLTYVQDSEGFTPVANLTFKKGVLSGITYSTTGSLTAANFVSSAKANPHFSFIDTDSYGFGIVEATVDKLTCTLVSTPAAFHDMGTEAPAPLYRASFTVKDRLRYIDGPHFEGTPPFPYEE
ncbi:MAG: alkaline phosphatase D family protein [Alphaproteobacteria bacterium]